MLELYGIVLKYCPKQLCLLILPSAVQKCLHCSTACPMPALGVFVSFANLEGGISLYFPYFLVFSPKQPLLALLRLRLFTLFFSESFFLAYLYPLPMAENGIFVLSQTWSFMIPLLPCLIIFSIPLLMISRFHK